MSAGQIFKQAVAAVQKHDLDGYARILSDDLEFSGPTPEPIGKQAYLSMLRTMLNAFPDLQYHFRIIDDGEQVVRYASHFTGTHTGELDLSAQGMGIIPPTGKSFATPEEEGEVTVRDGKIARIQIFATGKGGIQGILQQLGVQPG